MAVVGAAVSLASAGIAIFFTAMVFRLFLERRKPHNVAWTVGLAMFAAVALVQATAEFGAWTDGLFRAWYVFGTSLVAFLGLGSVYIVHRRLGHAFAAYVVVLFLAFLAVALITKTDPAAIATFGKTDPTTGAVVSPSGQGWAVNYPRLLSPLFTIPGSATLIGLALYGYVRHRLKYNLWIAGGAVVLAVFTGLARYGVPEFIYIGEFAGIALMFVGFRKAVEWAKEQRASARGGGPPPTPRETDQVAADTVPK